MGNEKSLTTWICLQLKARLSGRNCTCKWKISASIIALFVLGLVIARREGNTAAREHSDSLFTAWQRSPETCEQWIAAQRSARAYLDAYFVGAQKASTSEISRRLYDLGILHHRMRKEWHFFQNVQDASALFYRPTALHRPYRESNIPELRLHHYLSGFRHLAHNITSEKLIPLVSNASRDHRKVTYDATVEYMVSTRVAFLAHLLNPHAKIIMAVREPISRALSQYNMVIRETNKWNRIANRTELVATAAEFDKYVRWEMKKLGECGYNWKTAELDRTTSELLDCVFPSDPDRFTSINALYVTRGLYHLHISTWQQVFPRYRMHFVRFNDITSGDSKAMQGLTRFLCVRQYPNSLLQKYKMNGSTSSYGVQAASLGLGPDRGLDNYEGNNRYLVDIFPSTRKALQVFFHPANHRLFEMMGQKMY